ncbi:hypothetical protein FRC04_011684 [Tulasnella sp. 424]|nr:hypothetical protein FRC04_011684 [Tulasnella sp. 424]
MLTSLSKSSSCIIEVIHRASSRPVSQPEEQVVTASFTLQPGRELSRELLPFAQGTRTDSFKSPSSGTTLSSVFSSVASGFTQETSLPSTPSANSASFCLSSAPPSSPVPEHTAEIKAALAKFLKRITSFVAPSAHYLSGDDFMAGTSAVNDLPNIRIPCLAISCADDPLMPGEHPPRSQAMESPFVMMAVLKKGGHLGTFTRKRWKKEHGNKRYHTALVEGDQFALW